MMLKRLNKKPIDKMDKTNKEKLDMVNKLIETIGREAALFESFLELLETQQKMLVENDCEGLKEITASLHEKLIESQQLNDNRFELVEEIRKLNNIEDDLNVSRLIEIIDKTQADRLSQLQETILNLNEKILETRNQNAMLLNRSREYISKTMEMLSRTNCPKGTYSSQGTASNNNMNIVVDRRV